MGPFRFLRRAPHDASQRRKDESVYRHVVIAVVRGDAVEHVGDVVEPSQHEIVVEIELLDLRVRRHVVRVGHLEDALGFATFDVRLELSRRETHPSKEERCCQVVPDRVAEKNTSSAADPTAFRVRAPQNPRADRTAPRRSCRHGARSTPDSG